MRTSHIAVILAVTVSASTGFAQVCDLSELNTVSAAGSLSQPAILSSTAYVAAGSAGIARLDVSDPTALAFLDAHATQGQGLDIVLDFFTSRLVVADGSAGISTYRIDTDGLPVHQGTLDIEETAISIGSSGNLWLAGSQEGSLYTLSISDDGPIEEGSVTTGGQVRSIIVHMNRAYCALGDAGVAVVDVSQRDAPEVVTTADLGGSVLSVVRDGSLLYCGVEGVGLVTVRIDGDTLIQAGSLSLDAAPTRLIHWGGRIYIASPDGGVSEADASLGSEVLLLASLDLEGANGLALVGDDLFVGRGVQGFSSVDTSDCASSGVFPTSRFIPAAARAVGVENTFWVSDVAIGNMTDDVATYNMAYLVKNQENSTPVNVSVVLQPGQQQLLSDVFGNVFELDTANGALRITGSHPDVRTTSRTYNAAGAEGTYGQFIPALPREDALEPGVAGALLQLQENEDFRTNVGLLNITEETAQVEVELYLGTGNLVGVRNETLLPFEMVQLDRIFETVGAGNVDSGFAVINVLTDGQVMAYASVVDNSSGDPIYIPAQLLTTGTPFAP